MTPTLFRDILATHEPRSPPHSMSDSESLRPMASRAVPRTGVIDGTTEASRRGDTPTDSDRCNLGQGQPETGPLEGAPERVLQMAVDPADHEHAPVAALWELRESVASLDNERDRRDTTVRGSARARSLGVEPRDEALAMSGPASTGAGRGARRFTGDSRRATATRGLVFSNLSRRTMQSKKPTETGRASKRARTATTTSSKRASRARGEDPAKKSSTLARSEDALLAEAERRGREVFSEGERLVHEYGEWLFANFFSGETAPVLDRRDAPDAELTERERSYRERWRSLVAACGSARMPLSQATLSNTVRVAAWDKRLADGSWNGLAFSLKVALLPLNDAKAMRAAARHVLSATLDARGAHEYVAALLHPNGKPLRITPQTASKRVFRLAANVGDDAGFNKLATQLGKLDDDAKSTVADKLEFTIDRLKTLLSAVKKR